MWALVDEAVNSHRKSRQATRQETFELEPSLIRFLLREGKDRNDCKLKSLIMAQIERWRQA